MHLEEKAALEADFVASLELLPSLESTEQSQTDLELSLVAALAVLFEFVFQEETVHLDEKTALEAEQLADFVVSFETVVDSSLDVVIVVLFESYFVCRGESGGLGEWLAFVVVPGSFVWQESSERLETELRSSSDAAVAFPEAVGCLDVSEADQWTDSVTSFEMFAEKESAEGAQTGSDAALLEWHQVMFGCLDRP